MQYYNTPDFIMSYAESNGLEPRFYKITKALDFCGGCGRLDVPFYALDLCRSCYANWMRQKRKFNINVQNKGDAMDSDYREKALKQYGNKPHCNECGVRQVVFPLKPELAYGIPNWMHVIHIHHIDGDKKNNSINNLETLCTKHLKRGDFSKNQDSV